MKKCLFAGLLFAVLMPGLSHAQADSLSVYNNSLKINTLGMVLHNVSLLYERSLNEHWSIQAGGGYRWGGDIPKALALGNIIVDAQSRGIRGYSLTPELRYYFNICDCKGSPSGLYAGLYASIEACIEVRLRRRGPRRDGAGDGFLLVLVPSRDVKLPQHRCSQQGTLILIRQFKDPGPVLFGGQEILDLGRAPRGHDSAAQGDHPAHFLDIAAVIERTMTA